MSYELQICHANELIYHRWRVVDRFSEFSTDALLSPSFDVSDGLLAQIVDGKSHYAGVFYDGSWVDVGPQSVLMQNARRATGKRALNLFEVHLECTDIFNYLELYCKPAHRIIDCEFLYNKINEVRVYAIGREGLVSCTLEAMRKYVKDGFKSEDWHVAQGLGNEAREIAYEINDLNNSAYHAMMAFAMLHGSFQDPLSYAMMAHAVYLASFNSDAYSKRMKSISARYAEEYRQAVPFHDLVMELLRT